MKNSREHRILLRQANQATQPNEFVEKDGYKLATYKVDGEFSYEKYKNVQTLGNKAKIENQWVGEDHIKILADFLNDNYEGKIGNGVCHGTRRGNEQLWFTKNLNGEPDVLGTEISDTANEFPNTIQWDFHEKKQEWDQHFAFVYSNSWDHTYDPEKLFTNWASCLAPSGYMLVDHGWNYNPKRVDILDAFGISEDGLVDLLNRTCSDVGSVVDVLDGGKHKRFPIRTIVFKRFG